ncbi:MAG: HK97 family phage prohead protease [Prevotella sp.]|nr:HK97 family phage prohead protease [Prevotella sp.]
MDAKREIRTIECQLAVREAGQDAQGESRTITGTAIVFNAESEVLDEWGYKFREVILPEAAQMEFLNTQDIKLNMLHDRQLTVARANKGKGSLRLSVDEKGVNFEFEAPKCDIGDRCLEMVRRGDYSGCSFEFYPEDYDVEERNNGQDVKITHRKFRAITALTIGLDPAYKQTSVNARELQEATDTYKTRKAEEERKAQEEKEREEKEKEERIKREMQRRVAHLTRMADFDKKLESTTF